MRGRERGEERRGRSGSGREKVTGQRRPTPARRRPAPRLLAAPFTPPISLRLPASQPPHLAMAFPKDQREQGQQAEGADRGLARWLVICFGTFRIRAAACDGSKSVQDVAAG
uniref:Uncharacterized protein n=1 Tax=Triticum urartu TaxID=4572 RepID=A0A8R7P5D8_TRIUA